MYPIKSSFTAGEIAPELYGRPDLQKYASGAASIENFCVLPYGGLARRPGTRFIRALESGGGDVTKIRLIPFQFSLDDSYVLCFEHYRISFFREGQAVETTEPTEYKQRGVVYVWDTASGPRYAVPRTDSMWVRYRPGSTFYFMDTLYTVVSANYITKDGVDLVEITLDAQTITSSQILATAMIGDDLDYLAYEISDADSAVWDRQMSVGATIYETTSGQIFTITRRIDTETEYRATVEPVLSSTVLTDGTQYTFGLETSVDGLDDVYQFDVIFMDEAPGIYYIASPYSIDDLSDLSYAQSADVLFMVTPNKRPYELARYSTYNWIIEEFAFSDGPFAARTESDIDIRVSLSGDATIKNRVVTVNAEADLFEAGHVGELFSMLQSVDGIQAKSSGSSTNTTRTIPLHHQRSNAYGRFWAVFPVDNPSFPGDQTDYASDGTKVYTLMTPGNSFVNNNIRFVVTSSTYTVNNGLPVYIVRTSPDPSASDIPQGESGTGVMGGPANDYWTVELFIYDTWHVVTSGFWYGSIAIEYWNEDEQSWIRLGVYASPQSANTARNYDLSGELAEPSLVRVVPVEGFTQFIPSGNNANDQGVVELSRPSSLWRGIGRITKILSSLSAELVVQTPFARTDPSINWQRGAWSSIQGWPRTIGFFEERLVLGGTWREPQTLWFSKTGDYYNFGTSLPLVDDDAITRTLASRQLNRIEAIVPLNELIVMTSTAEWRITGGQQGGLTPTNFTARVQGYRGCSNIEPLIVNATTLFVQAKGSKINDLIYSYDVDLYQGTDLTILAPHIFSDFKAKDWAYQQEPYSIVWICRDDGMLVSLTYMREHDVIALARHPMQNAFVFSCANLNARDEDTLYLLVRRNGRPMIETMVPKRTEDAAGSYYVDSGVTLRADTPVTSIHGLGHLEGQVVDVVADGNYIGSRQVINGVAQIDSTPSFIVHAGLPFVSYAETLDMGFDDREGTRLGRKHRIPAATIRCFGTRGLLAASADDSVYTEVKDRNTDDITGVIPLFTGDYSLRLESRFNGGRVKIKTQYPFPARILAIIPEVELGD